MQTFWKSDMRTRTDETNRAETARVRAYADACKVVDERDGYRCRVCGSRGSPTSTSLLNRLHHHHLVFRSRGRDDSPENLVCLCPKHHDEIHVKKLLSIEGNASAAPWLTISRHYGDWQWFVVAQECGVREYIERD